MNITKQLLAIAATLLASTFLIIALTFFLHQIEGKKGTSVSSISILQEIQENTSLVTKTVIVDQSTEIIIDEGSRWSNLLWGQTIEAEALIRFDIGVDLSQLTEEHIVINERNKTVTITLPEAEILNASQFGDIEVQSKSGILKYLLDNDPSEDHNLSLSQLIDEATASVKKDENIFEEAREESIQLLRLIIQNTGYELIIVEENINEI